MTPLELWGGVECTVNRVGDRYFDQLRRGGHDVRIGNLTLLADLGIKAIRYPILWERTAPGSLDCADWTWADERMARLRQLGLRVIVGLVHHGSGPQSTSLLDESFIRGLTEFGAAVARRYPWVEDFTPVNEPLTTARFSALYGHWYPHHTTPQSFARALMVQVRATASAMKAIRAVTPSARLVQTEDIGTVASAEAIRYQADYENERRFLSLDLLSGLVTTEHPFHEHLIDLDVSERDLAELEVDPCEPDVVGVNYYVTSDRFLDHDVGRYPAHTWGGNGQHTYADVESVRVRPEGITGHAGILRSVWDRYRHPIALTETHLGATPEDQIRWLDEAWRGALAARSNGADVQSVTLWSAFGSHDWNSLVTRDAGHYEPGAFDVRTGTPRPTALAHVARQLAKRSKAAHPLLDQPGWWRRDDRLTYARPDPRLSKRAGPPPRPILITGASGTLAREFLRACTERQLVVRALTRSDLDVLDAARVEAAIVELRPWLVINAAGFAHVEEARHNVRDCHDMNFLGASTLARACSRHGVRLMTFSSGNVFDGRTTRPYLESDEVRPVNVLGASHVLAEEAVRSASCRGLIIRAGKLFGGQQRGGFFARLLQAAHRGERLEIPSDRRVSIAYLPDLAHACLDLAIDCAEGVHHLANEGGLSLPELARSVCSAAKLPANHVVIERSTELHFTSDWPLAAVLSSERVATMPHVGSVFERWMKDGAGETLRSAVAQALY